MPTWATVPKDTSKDKEELQVEKSKASSSTSEKVTNTSKAKSFTPAKSKQSTSKRKQVKAAEKNKETTIRKGEGKEENVKRQGHFGLLDAVIPKQAPPLIFSEKTNDDGESSSSRKGQSEPTRKHTPGSLSFTKSAPTSSAQRKRGGGRKSNSASKDRKGKEKEKEKEDEQDDGEYNEHGFWIPAPKPPKAPASENHDTPVLDDVDVVSLEKEGQATPTYKSKGKGRGKQVPDSSPSPPPTKLKTPALARSVADPKITQAQETPLPPPLPLPQNRGPRNKKDPHFLLDRTAREDINRQLKHHAQDKVVQQEPLFLPNLSPDTVESDHPPQILQNEETEEDENVESPVERPVTRRSITRERSYRANTDEDYDTEPGGGIPPPSFLVRRREMEQAKIAKKRSDKEEKHRGRHSSRTPQPASAETTELVPCSDDEAPLPTRHFGIEITPFVDNSPSPHSKRKSKPSSRKTKRYGKGRSHAYQHGYPLLYGKEKSSTLTPPPPLAEKSSYRGAKRKGSTSGWIDNDPSSDSNDEEDGVAALYAWDHGERSRTGKKKKRWTRNGPPPDQRLLGLFGEDEDQPHRFRHKRGRTPKFRVSEVLRLNEYERGQYNEDDDDDDGFDHDAERRRKKRRKKDIVKRHHVAAKNQPKLNMTRNNSCQARVTGYLEKVGQTLTLPKRPLHDSKAVRGKSYKRMQGVPLYACKPIDTISYTDYVKRYKEDPPSKSESNSSKSNPSNPHREQLGRRIDELLAAGRKSRFERGIRRQRPITRDITPRLPLVTLKPSQDDPQILDAIDVEPSKPINRRRRGSSLGNPLVPKNVPRLRFTKDEPPSNDGNDRTETGTNTNTNSRSIESSEPRDAASVLGHLFPIQTSKSPKKREMPQAFRQNDKLNSPEIELSDDTPENDSENPQNHYHTADPIIEYTQESSQVPQAEQNQTTMPDDFARPAPKPMWQLPDDDVSRPAIDELAENQSQLQDEGNHVHTPDATINDEADVPGINFLPQVNREDILPQKQTEYDQQEANQPEIPNLDNDNDAEMVFGSQINWEYIGNQIGPSQWERLDADLAEREVEMESKRNNKSASTSQHEVGRICTSNDTTNTAQEDALDQLFPTKENQGLPIQPKRSQATARRMTGMEITEQLLQRPILPSIAQNIGKTFINTNTNTNTNTNSNSNCNVNSSGERRSVGNTSRRARREEREKRVREKRSKAKRKEVQTKLDFTSRSSISRSRNEMSDDDDVSLRYGDAQEITMDDHIDIPPQQAEANGIKRNLTLSEEYRNIHPSANQTTLNARATAPSRFSLGNQPVIRNYREAVQPSIKALEERNSRSSQEALTKVFVPPITRKIGKIISRDEEDMRSAVYEPTQVSTVIPPAAQGSISVSRTTSTSRSRSKSKSRANSLRNPENQKKFIGQWTSEIEPIPQGQQDTFIPRYHVNPSEDPRNDTRGLNDSYHNDHNLINEAKNTEIDSIDNEFDDNDWMDWVTYEADTRRNQGGNPFENDSRTCGSTPQATGHDFTYQNQFQYQYPNQNQSISNHNSTNVENTSRKGKRRMSAADWVDSQP
ncbi:uncharacterized protein L201_000998 [Kwoniella dendrophila CBS 6074]|uniref:Uncharacterized protein n=1 Tax=Kwoniella dendrophila CBS 6074 TaxID=1295534 RepID=A0AAX4JMT3_9TREE